MARAIWKGHLSFGLVEIPIQIVSATASAKSELDFRMLDAEDKAPVGYKRVNKRTGEEVPYERIVKGLEVEEGRYVLVDPEELQAIRPEVTKSIDVFAFVDREAIDPMYFDKPYYLAPVGKGRRAKAYALLRDTLVETGRVGLAKVVIRTRQYVAAVIPHGDALVLEILRYAHEVRPVEDAGIAVDELNEQEPTESEKKLARTLVDQLSTEFHPEEYQDEYRDAVLEYVERKLEEGETARMPAVAEEEEGERAGEVVDIMELLKRSVEASRARGEEEEPAEKKKKKGKKKTA